MSDKLFKLLFPSEYREFPQQRLILNLLRALHILTFSVLVGGIFFQQSPEFIFAWAIAAIVSGSCMFALDIYNSLMVVFELRGFVILIKIALLFLITVTDGFLQVSILFSIVIFSSLTSHASKRLRHTNIMPLSFQKKYGFNKKQMKKSAV